MGNISWSYIEAEKAYCTGDMLYCAKPLAPALQALRVFVPEAYLNADGTLNTENTLTTKHGAVYTASTAPIVFYNDVGGYSECRPAELTERNRRYLQDGYVLVSAGARGRQSRDEAGSAIGKAPAALADLKAGIRWLRAHREQLPGDTERIISVGTSAGGALSSLLGVTGNCADYLPYLEEIGAAMGESDAVFAAQCYCPITDLNHADQAYEWMFGSKLICTRSPRVAPQVLDETQRKLSRELAAGYPEHINTLELGYTLGADGRSGSFYDALMERLSASLTTFLLRQPAEQRGALAEELDAGSGWLEWDGKKATISDLDHYVRAYVGRMKDCPAFDALDGDSFENQEFGSDEPDKLHFSPATARAARSVGAAQAEDYRQAESISQCEKTALLDPLYQLRSGKRMDTAPHFRIRLGSRDADTSFGVGFSLYCALKASGRTETDYALVWGRGHCDADYPGEFSAWVDSVCAKAASK